MPATVSIEQPSRKLELSLERKTRNVQECEKIYFQPETGN